jgi:hypothetical protein
VDPSGGTVTYQWDVGDGASTEGENVAHTYTKGGIVPVILPATDDEKNVGKATAELLLSDNVAPYAFTRLGTQGLVGLVTVDASGPEPIYCLNAGGSTLFQSTDHAYFLHKAVSGDFKVTARVTAGDFTALKARAGLMARLSADSRSANVAMVLDPPDDGLTLQVRAGDGQPTTRKGGPAAPPRGAFPVWIRLERQGATFIGSYSLDGVVYNEYAREDVPNLNVVAGAELLVGFAATSGDIRTRAEYCAELDFGGGPPPTPPFHRGDADGNGQLQLTDAVRVLNVLFLGTGVLLCTDAADADDNGQIQLTDAVRVLNVLFLGTGTIPNPGPPSEACGPDPTEEDALDCGEYTKCL